MFLRLPRISLSLGMAAGPVAGGMIYDATGGYGWLYLGSATIGVGAFLIALTFKPFPKPRLMAAPEPTLNGVSSSPAHSCRARLRSA